MWFCRPTTRSTLRRPRSISVSKSTTPTLTTSRSTTSRDSPGLLASTSVSFLCPGHSHRHQSDDVFLQLPILPTPSLLPSTLPPPLTTLLRPRLPPLSSMSLLSPPLLTGAPRVPSPPSRTRDSAAHAGLSPPLDPLRDSTSLPLATSCLFPSRTSLTAALLRETRDATVVS